MDKQNRFKRVAFSAILFTCFGCTLEAQSEEKTPIPLKSNSSLKTDAHRLKAISEKTVHGDLAGKSPGFLSKNGGFFITGDVLYWKAKQDNLDYAAEFSVNTATTPQIVAESILEPHFRWGWGFRIDAGYGFGRRDDWELDGIWTYFHSKGSGSTSLPASNKIGTPTTFSSQEIIPSWGEFLGNFAFEASSHWGLHLNLFDFELAKNYFMSKRLSARPHVGLRGAIIHQNIDANYLAGLYITQRFLVGAGSGGNFSTSMNAKNHYSGIGPRIGTNLLWQFLSHWGLYGNISASLLYGRFNVSQKYSGLIVTHIPSIIFPINATVPGSMQNHRHAWRVRTNVDSGVGLEWETFFAKTMHLTLGIGYEISYWFKQLQLMRTSAEEFQDLSPITGEVEFFDGWVDDREGDGDLAMQGWNFHVRFDF